MKHWPIPVVMVSMLLMGGSCLAAQNDFNDFYNDADATIASATTEALAYMSFADILIMASKPPNKINLETSWQDFVTGARTAGMTDSEIMTALTDLRSEPVIGSVSGLVP